VCVASCYAAYHASYTLLAWAMGLCSVTMHVNDTRGHRLGLGSDRCVPHSLPPPKKICVFLYSHFAGYLAVAGISFYGFRVALVVTLFFVYTAQHGYGDAND
jgi:hypothetical protein